MITRKASSTDGRSQDISLTEYGIDEAKRVIEITYNKIFEMIENLNKEDCDAVCNAMICIEERMEIK